MKNKIHWDQINKLAIAHTMEEPASSVDALVRFLRMWWCKTYNRPLKDPLLMSYTADELCYEYLRHFYLREENDPKKKIEAEAAKKEDEEWIKKMLAQVKPGQVPLNSKKEKQTDTASKEAPKEVSVASEVPDLPEISAKFDPPE